jgi:nucleotide-binding universal stress UspA family protein
MTASSPNIVELFNARLADEWDLRTAPDPALALPNRRRRRKNRRAGPGTARTAALHPRRVRHPAVSDRGILVVLDESEMASRAVTYVGRLLGRRRGFRVCIAYVLPELPSGLLEHGGAADPRREERLASSLRDEQRGWIADHKREAGGLLDEATRSLRRAGLRSSALTTRFCGPVASGAAADEVLELARAQRCRTVVVGRRRLSWFGHLFAEDLRADLARRGGGIAIWGIG